jgi:hypothetical protein
VAFQAGGSPFYQQAYEQGARKGSIYDPGFGLPAAEREALRASREPRKIVLPAGTSAQDAELVQMQNPDAAVSVAGGGRMWDAIKRGLTYSSDVEAQRMRAMPNEMAAETARLARSGIAAGAPPATVMGASGIAQAAPPAKNPPPAGNVAGPRGTAPVGIAQAVPAPVAAPAADMQAEMDALRKLSGSDDAARQRKELIDTEESQGKAAAQAEVRDYEEQMKALGPVGAGREKRLKEQEARIKEGEGKNIKMTLIEAGLAIMAGRSSNALTNLAEGAAAGLKGYQARLDKAEAARAKLAEGMDVLEELRRAEAVATGDKKRELTRQIRAVESGANKARVDALTAEAGISSKQAEMVYKAAEDRAAMEKKQAFEAKEKALDRANTLAYADKMMAGRGDAGGNSLAAQKEHRAVLTARINAVKANLSAAQRGFTPADRQAAAQYRAEIAALEQELARLGTAGQGGAGGAAPVNSTGTTRIRFDAQGNMIQ